MAKKCPECGRGMQKYLRSRPTMLARADSKISKSVQDWFCPKCDSLKRLGQKVSKTIRFIQEKLRPRDDVNQKLLNDYEEVLKGFSKMELGEFQGKLAQIRSRPAVEGAEADYTEGTSLEFESEHKMLMEYLNEIEDLVSELRKTL